MVVCLLDDRNCIRLGVRIQTLNPNYISQTLTTDIVVPVQAFSDIKNYYNDITHNNLDLIKTLKEDVTEMKKKDSQNEKLMFEIAQENKRLSEPLQKVTQLSITPPSTVFCLAA